VVARTSESFVYEPGRPALVLLDFDTKGMPPEVDERIKFSGGFEAAIASVLPELHKTQRLIRASTSAGLYRSDTGNPLPASNGLHEYLLIRDGADAERFLRALHVRLFLAGLGWLMTGKAGQLLERSIVDRMVAAPERLVFEGPPLLMPPVAQDAIARQPHTFDGEPLDTIAACRPLTIIEQSDFAGLRAKQASILAPEIAKQRKAFIDDHSERLARSKNIGTRRAHRTVERQCDGVLLPDYVLEFDDPELAGITVTDVLADPYKYVGETLSDPLEGPEYGRCKAMIMLRGDGSPWVHSFAHGRTVYELKFDYAAAEKAINSSDPVDAPDVFVRFATAADLTDAETERLRDLAAQRGGIGKRTLDSMLKEARSQTRATEANRRRDEQRAARRDPRPQIEAPSPDAEWLPVMRILNEAHAVSNTPEPPMRDRNNDLARVAVCQPNSLHLLSGNGDMDIPPPAQALIQKLNKAQVAEMIERHAEFVEKTKFGVRPVHLHAPFVRHFMNRDDHALPTVAGVSSLPIVLRNGDVLTGRGLDRRSGIVFRVPPDLWLPAREECDDTVVGQAITFLCDEWLCDVATDYAGKCINIACALTIIERLALPERPAFFIVAGQRGGGKTTTLHMISTAVIGVKAAAASWSPNEEERRKALFAYLSMGLPFLVWDNVPLGAAIGCPAIERALTTEVYSDRVLGVSEYREVSAHTVMAFTGNNIAPRGDLSSRSLVARIVVDRPDPENRKFTNADPVGWTEQNRGDILSALYTILLGNPRFHDLKANKPAETRFKAWWHLVGAAIEHAACCCDKAISFKNLFLDGERDDEQSSALGEVLKELRRLYRIDPGFRASDIAERCRAVDLNDNTLRASLTWRGSGQGAASGQHQ
jgi:hypothetical protein